MMIKTRIKCLFVVMALVIGLSGCGGESSKSPESADKMELVYASQFEVEYLKDQTAVITIAGKDKYAVLPEKEGAAEKAEEYEKEGIRILDHLPDNIYVASSAAMDLFLATGGMDKVKMTSTSAENWTIPEIRDALNDGSIEYVGKYSMPDYERLVDRECDLAVENTMIGHVPEVKEQLERLGIPVLTDYSSYEEHPLGRMEWIKLYGLITGHEKEAEDIFEDAAARYRSIERPEQEGKTVAFFYITSSGLVNIRKPDDYIVKMIENAGGKYAFKQLTGDEDDARLTTNLQMEVFYEIAKDADIIIYNSTIDGKLDSIDELIEKSSLISDFKAVKEGNVWCTEADMFQQTAHMVDMAEDFYRIICDETGEEPVYMYRLE